MKHKAVRMSIEDDPLAYVQAHLVRNEESGCVIYLNYLNNHGYGFIRLRDKKILVHKFMWEQEYGPVAEGMELDHLCGVQACCNTAHLEEVTHVENMRRWSARRKACRKGHPITPESRCENGCKVCRDNGRRRRASARSVALT